MEQFKITDCDPLSAMGLTLCIKACCLNQMSHPATGQMHMISNANCNRQSCYGVFGGIFQRRMYTVYVNSYAGDGKGVKPLPPLPTPSLQADQSEGEGGQTRGNAASEAPSAWPGVRSCALRLCFMAVLEKANTAVHHPGTARHPRSVPFTCRGEAGPPQRVRLYGIHFEQCFHLFNLYLFKTVLLR